MPGVGLMHPQHYTNSKENYPIHGHQTRKKTSMPPALTAPSRCKLYKGERYYASTCEANHKTDVDLRYKIMTPTSMAYIYLHL